MARGYYVSKGPKTGTLYMAVQGRIVEYDRTDPYMSRRIAWRNCDEPGLYVAKFNYGESSGEISRPAKIADEMIRLMKATAKPDKRSAYSLSPGVAGFQQRANASAVAQEQRRHETKQLIDLLQRLQENP